MRLPSVLLLCLAGCEPAHRAAPEPELPPTPVERASDHSLRDEFQMLPAVALKYAQPAPQPQTQPLPQPQPQPQVKPKPPRRVQASICGHPAPPNATPHQMMMRCGKG